MTAIIDKIAWIHIENGRVLGARSKGKSSFYIPGGKRDPGETDQETLIREIQEELSVQIKPDTIVHFGTFVATADGKAAGTQVQMTCYYADYEGELCPASEIEELAWLTHADRDQVSPATQMILDHLYNINKLS
ncbi:NUDIX domain-containing protein [Paenibacillus sp. N1-5-1-14]|uniref:NUDIX hydrolase n=1 Tax=Paenibacillus radicibacter TaxID=2972488 RepID=UPI0021593719|nr:NUDIX domain-containing protein [Paenibacillus radicibacter]MCR8644603.1 NUDIX domain-containing protein [Paenibacillus radicibacter]